MLVDPAPVVQGRKVRRERSASCCIHRNTETSVRVHGARRSQLRVTCSQLSWRIVQDKEPKYLE